MFLPISNEAFAVSFVSLQEVVYIFTAEQQFNFLFFNLHEHLMLLLERFGAKEALMNRGSKYVSKTHAEFCTKCIKKWSFFILKSFLTTSKWQEPRPL